MVYPLRCDNAVGILFYVPQSHNFVYYSMRYDHLRMALDEYTKHIQGVYKSHVQVRTGALRDSIKVTCTINDNYYALTLSANEYWRFIPEVFPWRRAEVAAGLPPSPVHLSSRAFWDNGSRYPIDWARWQIYLNYAFEQDVQEFLNGDFNDNL